MSFNLITDIREIILRDLQNLKEEVSSTKAELLWEPLPGIINPVGTLAFHLCGNLRHFIGAVLGKDGYVRDREAEFSNKYFSKEELLAHIDATIGAVSNSLTLLKEEDLHREMPDTPPQHKGRTVGFFLIQLCCHLSRHRGQLDYLRRISAATP
ncbi:MAG: hypothetical protein RL213_1073 [Bacteroidota bacterium]|jgi:uncharacterized damage-inducible protein DinB